jgi:hypothetical protein
MLQFSARMLKLPSLMLTMILCVVEFLIYWLGNPIICGDLAWHHLPEMGAVFFLGVWFKEIDLGARAFIFLCAIMSLMVVWFTANLLALLALSMFEVPFILGYLFAKEKPR